MRNKFLPTLLLGLLFTITVVLLLYRFPGLYKDFYCCHVVSIDVTISRIRYRFWMNAIPLQIPEHKIGFSITCSLLNKLNMLSTHHRPAVNPLCSFPISIISLNIYFIILSHNLSIVAGTLNSYCLSSSCLPINYSLMLNW